MGESFTFNGVPLADEKNEFLEQVRVAREKRATDQKNHDTAANRQRAAGIIQRFLQHVVGKRILKEKAM